MVGVGVFVVVVRQNVAFSHGREMEMAEVLFLFWACSKQSSPIRIRPSQSPESELLFF